jgi:1-acyl-sn-glycerol-3-phosphate acyltransferase
MLLRFIVMVSMALAAIVGLPLGIFESAHWLWVYPLLTVGFILIGALIGYVYLLIMCKAVKLDVEQERDDPRYRRMVELYLDSVLPVVRVGVKTKGLNKVPKDGRFLLVCNHCNDADPLVILRELSGHQLAFISKKENREMFIIGPLMHKLMCQMIDRENDREALKTILKCIRLLKEDQVSIAVFPEGRISMPDRKLHRFRAGVFKIAQKAEVPIVVCTLKNTRELISNVKHLRPTNVELTVVDVLEPEQFKGVPTSELAEQIYQMMAQDLGPENVAEEAK